MLRGERGFTLVEVLIATLVLCTAVVATAGLVGLAGVSIRNARRQSVSMLMASAKLDELRVTGASITPADALTRDVPGCVEYLDSSGQGLAEASAPPPEAVFVRRWSAQPLADDPADTVVLQVLVTSVIQARQAASPQAIRRPGDVLLVGLRAQREP